MKADFSNKTIWIVGASSGIGKEMALQLAAEKCTLIISARRIEKLNELKQLIEQQDSKCSVVALDLSDKDSVKQALKQVKSQFNQLDILINNAGIAHKSFAEETEESVDRKVMEINFFGLVNVTKGILPLLKKNGGTIATISSILGEFGLPYVSTYSASKHALNGYFSSLRYEVEKYNIKVLLVEPGFIKTEITKKSLTGSGDQFNKDSEAQEKGMNAAKCAAGILSSIKKGKNFSYVGGLETNMPWVQRFTPRLFYLLMKKMHKI